MVAVRGDADNPIFGGYTCIKGRNLPDQHNHPDRLRTSLKRMPDGSFQPISSEQAMDEIAEKLRVIIDRDGPRAVATYNGTYAYLYGGLLAISKAWHKGIGSPMMFCSASIDQPGKQIAMMRHGIWGGGDQSFDSSDVMLMVGCNPVVSMFAGIKFPAYNPWKRLLDAKKRGLKLVVIDPRSSDVASASVRNSSNRATSLNPSLAASRTERSFAVCVHKTTCSQGSASLAQFSAATHASKAYPCPHASGRNT